MISKLSVALADEPVLAQTFLVVERAHGEWDASAKIIARFESESMAEESALGLKNKYPQRHFGVAVMRSETRVSKQPFVIVRTEIKQ